MNASASVSKSDSPKVYLAGPISGLTYADCTSWRDDFVADMRRIDPEGRIRIASPLRGKAYLASMGVIEVLGEHLKMPMSTDKAIKTRDHWDVRTCDIMVVNLLGATRVSIGTMIELGWADAHGKPVILLMEDDNIHTHPIVSEIAGFRVTSVAEAVAITYTVLAI